LKPALKFLFALAVGAATVWSFLVPDAELQFQLPQLARILFYHLPCAIITSIYLFIGPYMAIRSLIAKTPEWDVRSAASNEIGFLFGLLTMSTGMLFSKVQWGAWWQWDPRQTSFLLVLLLYSGYFVLRAAFSDETKRAANSATYGVVMALPSLFLIFVFPRLPQVANDSFHPTTTIQNGLLKGDYLYVTLTMLVLFTVISAWLYKLRVQAGMAELALENLNGNLETRGGRPAPTGVVRPVPVPEQDREEVKER